MRRGHCRDLFSNQTNRDLIVAVQPRKARLPRAAVIAFGCTVLQAHWTIMQGVGVAATPLPPCAPLLLLTEPVSHPAVPLAWLQAVVSLMVVVWFCRMLALSPPETHQSVAKAAAGDHSMTPLQSSACSPRSLSDPAHGEALSHWYLMGVSYSAMPPEYC